MRGQEGIQACHLVSCSWMTATPPVSECMESFCDEGWEEGSLRRWEQGAARERERSEEREEEAAEEEKDMSRVPRARKGLPQGICP